MSGLHGPASAYSTVPVLRKVEAASPAAMPGFISPQLATVKVKPPAGDRWVHEIKYDGYRVGCTSARVRSFTRSGLDWIPRRRPKPRPIFNCAMVVPDGITVPVHLIRSSRRRCEAIECTVTVLFSFRYSSISTLHGVVFDIFVWGGYPPLRLPAIGPGTRRPSAWRAWRLPQILCGSSEAGWNSSSGTDPLTTVRAPFE
jgi:hypothetical protein